jgi:hypothetical protein
MAATCAKKELRRTGNRPLGDQRGKERSGSRGRVQGWRAMQAAPHSVARPAARSGRPSGLTSPVRYAKTLGQLADHLVQRLARAADAAASMPSDRLAPVRFDPCDRIYGGVGDGGVAAIRVVMPPAARNGSRRAAAVEMIDRTSVRSHQQAATAKRGARSLPGRSQAGFTTKIPVVVDAQGLPVRLGLAQGRRMTDKPQTHCSMVSLRAQWCWLTSL